MSRFFLPLTLYSKAGLLGVQLAFLIQPANGLIASYRLGS